MLFLGDLACPDEKIEKFSDCINNMPIFKDEIIIVNFEGNIVDNPSERRPVTLYNLSKSTELFDQSERVIASLANNHMYDYPKKILETKRILESHGIGTFGLYENGRILPYEFTDKRGKNYALFGHCWKLYTNTNCNTENDVRVVDCDYDEFVSAVSEYIFAHPGVAVYCFMHWNYDMEILPFPMHRKLTKKLIDCGVSGVIGNHSHVAQGYEIYNGKIIAYGLGNFYLPSGCYFDGRLSFPEQSRKTYGIRITDQGCDRIWFDTDCEESGSPIKLSSIDEDMTGKKHYEDITTLSDEQYLEYFKKHRVKRFLVPVFTEISGKRADTKEKWAIFRVKVLRFMGTIIKR